MKRQVTNDKLRVTSYNASRYPPLEGAGGGR